MICLTTSAGACISIRRLWILISNRSQVLVPSPQGDLRVVMVRHLVGMRTGPFTLRFFSLEPLIRSAHTAAEQGGWSAFCSLLVCAEGPNGGKCDKWTHREAEATKKEQRHSASPQHTLLKVLDVAGGEGHADAVHPGSLLLNARLGGSRLHGHLVCSTYPVKNPITLCKQMEPVQAYQPRE